MGAILCDESPTTSPGSTLSPLVAAIVRGRARGSPYIGTYHALLWSMFTSAATPVILVAAIDFSEISPLVARRAREAARQMNAAQLHFVHVQPLSLKACASTLDCERFGSWVGAQAAGETLAPSTQVLAHESSGDPDRAIVELATQLHASCIIVGARQRTSDATGQLGPVSRAVIAASDCPVLVVRP
jgi:universal stress protein family protein